MLQLNNFLNVFGYENIGLYANLECFNDYRLIIKEARVQFDWVHFCQCQRSTMLRTLNADFVSLNLSSVVIVSTKKIRRIVGGTRLLLS